MKKNNLLKKTIAVVTATSLVFQSVIPYKASASNGPSQPEFSSFEPVGTSGMVNEFGGDFTYNLPVLNIPGTDGGGYALSLSYHSGASPDEDASWVGYGWTLNPGAIVRNKRGFADDVKDGQVSRINSNTDKDIMPDNFTLAVGATFGGSVEGYGVSISGGVSNVYQYNNNTGFSARSTPYVNCSAYGVSMGYQYQSDGGGFDVGFSPMGLIQGLDNAITTKNEKAQSQQQKATTKGIKKEAYGLASSVARGGSSKYQTYTLQDNCFPTLNQSYQGESFSVTLGIQGEPVCTPISPGLGGEVYGSYSYQNIDDASVTGPTTYEGFMYSDLAYANEDVVMDYWVEKDVPMNIRDQFLGIPFPNTDMFTVMGEGIGGTFKPFSKYSGYFRPETKTSHTDMYDIGIDIMLGMDNGGGGRMGFLGLIDDAKAVISSDPSEASIPIKSGANTLTLQGWDDCDHVYGSEEDESYYMSFIGDLGGSGDFGNEDAQAATLSSTGGTVEGFKEYTPSLPSSLDKIVNTTNPNSETERVTRSSFIGYHTMSEMLETDFGGQYMKRYNRNYEIEKLAKRYYQDEDGLGHASTMTHSTSADNDDEYDYKLNQIAEFSITNKNENKFIYALPVYVNKESSFSFDAIDATSDAGSTDYTHTDHIVYKNTSSGYTKKVGESSTYPYASSWLLTSIHSPNYIDRTLDGETDDDFGGWTKFGYVKGDGDDSYAEEADYVNYRYPYRGLYNNSGSLSDTHDDRVSYSSGQRDNFYLYTIETKTHIAVFTISGRADGLDASSNPDDASNSTSKAGTSKFKKLDRIDLYVKDDDNTLDASATGISNNILVKSVVFDYDYSSWYDGATSVPNFSSSPSTDDPSYASTDGKGKLTLKRVWFEYGGIKNAGISPYQFSYTYPTSYPSPYCATCVDASGESTSLVESTSLDQNPSYNEANADAWGAYREDGSTRSDDMMNWVDQTPSSTFDPAAWQLKRITLPTGGSIDVQYEQNEYGYVQDRKAEAMVSLSTSTNISGTTGDKYYLNLSNDLGYTSSQWSDYVTMLKRKFIYGEDGKEPEKIYFKLLYSLVEPSSSGLNECDAEYITGYVNVYNVDSDASGVYLQLGNSSSDADEIPRQAALHFYNTNRQGSISSSSNCSTSDPYTTGEVATQILSLLTTGGDYLSSGDADKCISIYEANSYLRVPVLDAKKGGGVRVKRVLMYDPGVDSNDEGLYGTEYVYQNTDGTCSGVATNEPNEIREENALVTYLDKRTDQSWTSKLVAGNDKEQFEGPIGEGVLPGASVGYSRVIAKNIHDKITNNGFVVKEYFTSKDYPFDYDQYSYTDADGTKHNYEGVDVTDITKKIDDPWALSLLSPVITFKTWASQGFRFYINNMHGKPKSIATYSGDYAYVNNVAYAHCSSSDEFTYYEPGEPVKVVRNWEWNEDGNSYEWAVPGKQSEVVSESKYICDSTITASLEIDFSIGICGPVPVPYPTVIPYFSLNLSKLRSYSTSKVINLPSLVKSVRSMHDGMTFVTNNEYFDARTGDPIVTSKNDGYNGLTNLAGSRDAFNGEYYNYSFLASHYYDNLQQKSLTEKADFGGTDDCSITKSGSTLTVVGSDACGCIKFFTPGDLIGVYGLSTGTETWNVQSINGGYVQLSYNSNFYPSASDPNTSGDVTVNILESGKENQLSASVGSVTSYGGEPGVSNLGIDGQTVLDRSCVSAALNAALSTTALGASSTVKNFNCSNVTIIDNNGDCSPINSLRFSYQVYRPASNENELEVLLNDNCITYVTYDATYSFFISTTTGELMYGDPSSEECAYGFGGCIDFCPDPYTKLTGIVAASATELSDDWSLASRSSINNLYGFGSENEYETGAKGHWASKSQYGYETTITNITATDAHVWNSGIFDDFTVFNWESTYNNSPTEWISGDTVTVCSPIASVLETQNLFGVKSVSKYSSKYNLTYLIASNTPYENVMFESFETATDASSVITGEDGYSITDGTYSFELSSAYAHSGSKSVKLGFASSGMSTTRVSQFDLKSITVDDQIKENGITLRFWVKESGTTTTDITPYLKVSSASLSQQCTKVARVGEWILFQASLNSFSSNTSGSTFTPSIYFSYSSLMSYFSGTITVYVDDIRLQPSNSQTTAYVYDPTYFRLITQMDDQGFGLFYQYDAEGKLTRKQIETTNGFKTVSETEYNVPQSSR